MVEPHSLWNQAFQACLLREMSAITLRNGVLLQREMVQPQSLWLINF
jgi:hypothetical protein